jgi:hypothetical protein
MQLPALLIGARGLDVKPLAPLIVKAFYGGRRRLLFVEIALGQGTPQRHIQERAASADLGDR